VAYVVTAEWRARAGAEERLAELCEELTACSRQEPGNGFYEAHRSLEDGRRFHLYAEYLDAASYEAHRASEHYQRLVVGEAFPRLLERQAREVFDAASRLIDLSPVTGVAPPTRHAGRHSGSALRAVPTGGRDALALDRVIGTAVVLDLTRVSERTPIGVELLERGAERLRAEGETIRPGDIVLLRTDWTEQALGKPTWFRHSPALTQYGARWLLSHAPKCLGCDFFEPEAPVQREILDAGIPLVDGLVNLAALPARCEFFAPFCNFNSISAEPARAFAWVWEAA
jgi:kynurenine formamidase/quinol monooxygenase YgiN